MTKETCFRLCSKALLVAAPYVAVSSAFMFFLASNVPTLPALARDRPRLPLIKIPPHGRKPGEKSGSGGSPPMRQQRGTSAMGPASATSTGSPTSPTSSISPTSPTSPIRPTSPTSSYSPTSPTSPIRPTSPTSSIRPTSPTSSISPTSATPKDNGESLWGLFHRTQRREREEYKKARRKQTGEKQAEKESSASPRSQFGSSSGSNLGRPPSHGEQSGSGDTASAGAVGGGVRGVRARKQNEFTAFFMGEDVIVRPLRMIPLEWINENLERAINISGAAENTVQTPSRSSSRDRDQRGDLDAVAAELITAANIDELVDNLPSNRREPMREAMRELLTDAVNFRALKGEQKSVFCFQQSMKFFNVSSKCNQESDIWKEYISKLPICQATKVYIYTAAQKSLPQDV